MPATEQAKEDDDGKSLNIGVIRMNIHEVIFLTGSHCFLSTTIQAFSSVWIMKHV